jgi:hypothetical protein
MSELKILGEKKDSYSGNFVLENQTTATKDGFKNVSKTWFDKCIPFDKALEQCKKDSENVEDIRSPLGDWKPTISNDKFVFQYRDGRNFTPTKHAISNLCMIGGFSQTLPTELMSPKLTTKIDPKTGDPIVKYQRDKRDVEILVHLFKDTLFARDRVDQDKQRLFRTWKSNQTMRAALSSKYAVINNLWYLDLLNKLLPKSVLSHWKSDSDNLRGNILINDTIREEKDSDFGGMISAGNSEIGTANLFSQASVFRAICQNGCIWNQEMGVSIKRKHLGKIDLEELSHIIKHNIEAQIPLLKTSIDQFLATRSLKMGNVPFVNYFATVGQQFGITTKMVQQSLMEFRKETELLSKDAYSAFGLINSFTRLSHLADNDDWLMFDRIGGQLVMDKQGWDNFSNRAQSMDRKMVEQIIGIAA